MSTPTFKPVSECKTVADLLEDPARFTTEACARDAQGVYTYSDDPEAVCWCAMGAIWRIYGTCYDEEPIAKLCRAIGGGSIAGFNDERPHAEVLAAVRKAGI